MKSTRSIAVILVLMLLFCLLPQGAVEVKAAATVIHQPEDTSETVLLNYNVQNGFVDNQKGYSSLQTGTAMAQDGILDKNNGLAVTWMVQAPEAGLYTFDPLYYIGHFGSLKGDVYNMVWCVNDTRYYLGADITSDEIGTHKVDHGMDVVELPLDKGVNIVRMLPVAGPNYVYQQIDRGDGKEVASYINIYEVGIDSRLTVRKSAPLELDIVSENTNNFVDQKNGYYQSGETQVKAAAEAGINYDTLTQANLKDIPYISYTLNAPADGWYDMTLLMSSCSLTYGNDGYVIVRVNGTNYKRWFHGNGGFSDQNVSVPLKAGDNTVTITCAMGIKGGDGTKDFEKTDSGYVWATRFKGLTVYGGVTQAEAMIDPATVADAPLSIAVLEAETYGAGFNGYTLSDSKLVSGNTSDLTGLPSLRSLWDGAAFKKDSAPYVSFTVDVPTAGTYTLRADYTLTAADGRDALDYYMSASVNDKFYDKARFEPAKACSRTDGYSELVLELETGVNVIRLLPLLDGNPAAGVDIDKITLIGEGMAVGIAHDVTVLKAAGAKYHNGFTVSGDQLTGSTGLVTTYSALNSMNIGQTGYFAYTLDVPRDGYYDIHANVGSSGTGTGSFVLLLNGKKTEIPVALGRSVQDNTVNLSRYLTAGRYTFVLTGVLGQDSTMGALTVSGGITLAETQIDPLTFGVAPAVKEGGLVPGSVYSEQDFKLTNVPAGITLQEFESNFLERDQASFLNADGQALTANDPITAGCGVLYPNGTYYRVEALSQSGTHSVGASYMLKMCNPVGRQVEYKSAMLMESSASNFTIAGELSGDVTMAVEVDNQYTNRDLHSIFIEVDGVTSYINLKEGLQTVTLASGLSAGNHTIKVSKGSEAYRDDMYIYSITYTGTLQEAQAAARRIEFLGDSITAGSGVFFQHCGYGPTHSYFSYANMTADALGADYYSVANGGWRFTSTYNNSTSIATIYPYVSMNEDLGVYDNSAWKPDVIVINLGTNDAISARSDANNYTEATFEENIFSMLNLVREKNPDAEIIWVYGMMLSEKKEWIQSAVEKYALKDSKVHYVYCQPNTDGQGSHPDFEGSTANAEILVGAICEIMAWEVPTGTHATGDCGGAASCQFCYHNALTLPTHVYTDACDTQCNLTYVSESNGNTLECKHTRTAPHYSTDCTATTCGTCGKTKPAQATHSFANACDPDCDYPDCEYTRTVGPHSFVGDNCSACGATREAPAFAGASVTITDNLSLNFKVDAQKLADNGYTDPYVKFVFEGKSYVVKEAVADDGLLVFSFPEIAPHRVGSKVQATLCVKAGDETLSVTAEPYSVADYCYNMLGRCTDEKYGQLRTLLVDMLQYGAAAQLYMDPYASDLVTDRLTEAQKAEGTQTDRAPQSVMNSSYEVVDSPAATWKSATLLLKDAVKVRLKFAAKDIQGMTVVVKVGEQSFTIAQEELIPADIVGTYYVFIDQLDASQLSEDLLITVYRGGEKVSHTLRYSVESYAYNKRNDPDASLCELLKALIRYGDAARNYVDREVR